ncbi:Asp23/Gls24 family envelope stress response protein [Clostridium sp. 'deep sea']|uniref:Asp23/Gls24 family envelope stress response protein n=1 Tax=Clostridium sp. 'deep sea' TaxID=2779445 RepID=UPI0018965175|nr:Asp23/Gls24 family envelope stress response protein [Clostridium sp. 'deep sea']QOR35851.1 Asp23/Gls24 family envelope stress response protein [Clostridium sp. 'deep sea']
MNEKQQIGNIRIADDVVTVIAKIAAAEIDGVSGLTASFAGGIRDMMSGKGHSKGVKAQINDNVVDVDVHVNVKYGVHIPEAAKKVQSNIKRSIETMTGLSVQTVNVFVQGIAFTSSKSDKNNLTE